MHVSIRSETVQYYRAIGSRFTDPNISEALIHRWFTFIRVIKDIHESA